MRIYQYLLILIFLSSALKVNAQDFILLPVGHSHNDYNRERPLFDALDYGFTSIEVDVYWDNGRMVVTHDDKDLDKKPTLEELYLEPLQQIIKNNGGNVFRDFDAQLVLMVDLKSEKVETYAALKEIFSKYLDIINHFEGDNEISGPVKVLLSGNPPIQLIENEQRRYFFVDGAIDQWSKSYPVDLMPRASTNYRSYFKWYGKGDMPETEQRKLRELITKAHESERKVRFWGCPNRIEVWKKLLDEGVDWVNVDDLKGFYEFYRKRNSNN